MLAGVRRAEIGRRAGQPARVAAITGARRSVAARAVTPKKVGAVSDRRGGIGNIGTTIRRGIGVHGQRRHRERQPGDEQGERHDDDQAAAGADERGDRQAHEPEDHDLRADQHGQSRTGSIDRGQRQPERKRPRRLLVTRGRSDAHGRDDGEQGERQHGFDRDESGQHPERGPAHPDGVTRQRGKETPPVGDRQRQDRCEDGELEQEQPTVRRAEQPADAAHEGPRIGGARGGEDDDGEERGPRESARGDHRVGA